MQRHISEPHTIVVKIFSDGKFYDVKWTPDTSVVLRRCVKHDDVYYVTRQSERETCLNNRLPTASTDNTVEVTR